MTDEELHNTLRPAAAYFGLSDKVMEGFRQASEIDPHGKAPNEPGAKLDARKVRVGLMMSGFARALWAVAEVSTFGANKYTPNGWLTVPDGINRYTDAKERHALKAAMGEIHDTDSGLLHAAHEAWNALARLELMLRENEHVRP